MPPPRRTAVRYLRSATHWWHRHPRIMVAVRTALAAALAWYLAQLIPGPTEEYPYYAPMGAVATTSLSIRSSFSESLRVVFAIITGGLIGILAGAVGEETSPFVIAAAVLLAVLVSGHRVYGGMASWVPVVALFTLVVGYGQTDYVAAYAGMTLFGAAIGVAVTLALPQLPLAPAVEAVRRLRHELAAQLRVLREGLESEDPPEQDWWESDVRSIEPERAAMRSAVADLQAARSGNRRLRRYRTEADVLATQSDALARVTDLVRDLAGLISESYNPEARDPRIGADVQRDAARVLEGLADVLDASDEETLDAAADSTERALDDLVATIDAERRSDVPGGGVLVVSNLVVTARRCLDAILAGETLLRERRAQG